MTAKLRSALMQLKRGVENSGMIKVSKPADMLDYSKSKSEYYRKSIELSLSQIKESADSLKAARGADNIIKLINNLEANLNVDYIAEILAMIKDLGIQESASLFKKPKKIPSEIKEEINADLEELEKCFNSGCYRSCVILCGRILETALHRKYFESTGKDLLEKAPGTGLGKIIALLKVQNVSLDPAITQQIHLVNETRIHSVHVKKEIFNPSPEQTQAIILYTTDILNRLF